MTEVPYPEQRPTKTTDSQFKMTKLIESVISSLSKDGFVDEDGSIIYKGRGSQSERTGSGVLELVSYYFGQKMEGKPIDYKIFVDQFNDYLNQVKLNSTQFNQMAKFHMLSESAEPQAKGEQNKRSQERKQTPATAHHTPMAVI